MIKGLSAECNKEAERITKLIKGWKLGLQYGKAVNVLVYMPIEFNLTSSNQSITGRVTDRTTGLPFEGVEVVVIGKRIGTMTDADGCFKLNGVSAYSRLQFSSIGYTDKIEELGQYRSINVELEPKPYYIDF